MPKFLQFLWAFKYTTMATMIFTLLPIAMFTTNNELKAPLTWTWLSFGFLMPAFAYTEGLLESKR